MGERDVTTYRTQVNRTRITPKETVVGYKTVPTVQNVEVKNASTMKMTTEYAEPYIKRDGYTMRTGFKGAKTQVVSSGDALPAMSVQTIRVSQPDMGRGYTRIEPYKHCGSK